ncbi:MAG: hypothetical protein ABRQ37_13010 [Candidatus Eremiobacterota bacterium]
MVLFTVLCVMVILLIISLAIVSLSTGNMQTTGAINARIQALNLANSACMYAMYDIESNFSGNNFLPGPPPTPATGLSYSDHTYNPITNTNGLCGIARVAYMDNLFNPNPVTIVDSPSFYPSVTSTDLYGETAVIIGQGEYRGFKRTVKVTVKYTCFGSGLDGVFEIVNSNSNDGELMLNGIENITTLAPASGSLYARKGINYSNLLHCRFLNGSTLKSSGQIKKTGGGITIDERFLEPNMPPAPVMEWTLNNFPVTEGNPFDPNIYIPRSFSDIETLPVSGIARPSFPAAPHSIDDNQRYVCNGTMTVDKDTIVNGNLRIADISSGNTGNLVINNASLFINGTLTVDGNIDISSSGNLFVAGYYNDPSSTDPDFPFGLSMEVKKLYNPGIDPNNLAGLGIFTEGDIKIFSGRSSQASLVSWIQAMPLDVQQVIDIFNMFGLSGSHCKDAHEWYYNAVANKEPLLEWDDPGSHILKGCNECNNTLISKGLKPVPKEISQWFSRANTDEAMDWATDPDWPERWNTFSKNPSLYGSTDDAFLQCAIYTHGTLVLDGLETTVRIVGTVVSKDTPGISPNPEPLDVSKSHGGNVKILSASSAIILYPEYFNYRSPKFVIKPILTIYSWQEI